MELLPTKAIRHLALPTALAAVFTYLTSDPTYRFVLLALVLPVFQRGAAKALGVAKDTTDDSRIGRGFVLLGFAGFVVGWLLVFALLVFTVASGLLSLPDSSGLLKVAALLSAIGFVVAAWFWWPWYVRNELANWPRHDVRVWTKSSNRWDRLDLSWRMQQLAQAGTLRWRGFGATTALIASVYGLAATGTYSGFIARCVEILLVLALPTLHVVIVHQAEALCGKWTAERPAG